MGNVKGFIRASDLIRQEKAAGEIMREQIERFKEFAAEKGWELEFVDDEITVDTKGVK